MASNKAARTETLAARLDSEPVARTAGECDESESAESDSGPDTAGVRDRFIEPFIVSETNFNIILEQKANRI